MLEWGRPSPRLSTANNRFRFGVVSSGSSRFERPRPGESKEGPRGREMFQDFKRDYAIERPRAVRELTTVPR